MSQPTASSPQHSQKSMDTSRRQKGVETQSRAINTTVAVQCTPHFCSVPPTQGLYHSNTVVWSQVG